MRPSAYLIIIVILVLGLGFSIAGNLFLFKKAYEYHAREAAVRITPISSRFQQSNQALLAAAKTKTRLIILGESRCAMWEPYHPTNWGDLEIVNRGIGGETTPQILGRLQEDCLDLDPDIVLLQMGDNDLKTIAVLPGTQESTFEQTYQNITGMAIRLSDQGVQVALTTIFPPAPIELLRKPLWSDEVNQAIDDMNQRLLAFEYPRVTVLDCDSILRDGKYIAAEYSLDTLHLSEAGYRALNKGLETAMGQIVAAASKPEPFH
ncbi:SGNH/GDSL hydrolase family protein [Pelagicoccus albus]|uniref:SGNH hydrolase-type esterase domain-containing protein n=1 Tax=Pelagicoccus albus TaxID=415222 RepID=A0A7X1B507_9BACT|nr:GDSL-type esterase/lipase family protein [Pelagicoccus albus]MBC2605725.1 hypothetical protein [Pelagicoccus albus]